MMNSSMQFSTNYQRISDEDEYETDRSLIHLMNVPSVNARWHHIEDLDGFFTRVYKYRQRLGFQCIFWAEILRVLKFMFTVAFATFLYGCVNYTVLFHNDHDKRTLWDCVYDWDECWENITGSFIVMVILVVSNVFILICCFKAYHSIKQYYYISEFYEKVLHIKQAEIANLSWHDILQKLKHVQEEVQMCISNQHINELDIYNRILRHKNYYVAMVNKGLLTPEIQVPFVGKFKFWPHALKFNLDLIFFKGPWAAFKKSYQLHDDFKRPHKRAALEQRYKNLIFWLIIANIVLTPFRLLWEIVSASYTNIGMIKTNPEIFSLRAWSPFGRLYLRHFNELDHEFESRLCLAYKSANRYMKVLTPNVLTVICTNVTYFFSAIVSVMIVLVLIDEDVISVQGVVPITTIGIMALVGLGSMKPDENEVYYPEQEMRNVIANIHYSPPNWRGRCHTPEVRNEFSDLFQLRTVQIVEEILSPVLTPLILLFWLRPRIPKFIDFFGNFTVDVDGIGDVCSFALLDVRRHGDPQWKPDKEESKKSAEERAGSLTKTCSMPEQAAAANNGKLEMSLIHFAKKNPNWQPNEGETRFLSELNTQLQQDVAWRLAENTLLMNSSGCSENNVFQSFNPPQARTHHQLSTSGAQQHRQADGKNGDHSMYHSMLNTTQQQQAGVNAFAMIPPTLRPRISRDQIEMSASVLYLREMHHQKLHHQNRQETWESIKESDIDYTSQNSRLLESSRQQQSQHQHRQLTWQSIQESDIDYTGRESTLLASSRQQQSQYQQQQQQQHLLPPSTQQQQPQPFLADIDVQHTQQECVMQVGNLTQEMLFPAPQQQQQQQRLYDDGLPNDDLPPQDFPVVEQSHGNHGEGSGYNSKA